MLRELAQYNKISIVGLGQTGLSCARFLRESNLNFQLLDTRHAPTQINAIRTEFPEINISYGDKVKALSFSDQDLLIVSPGVGLEEPWLQQAREQGATLSSDVELFLQQVDTLIVVITGSNGKTTVASLTAVMLQAAGFKVELAGNIGVPVLDIITKAQAADALVLELSSFQLERLPRLKATAACVLNLSEDHMDRYASFEAYRQAKLNIYEGATTCIVNQDDVLTLPNKLAGRQLVSFGQEKPADFYVDGEKLCYQDSLLVKTSDLKLSGKHNYANVLAAFACCQALGASLQAAAKGAEQFKGIKHRCEWVAEIEGVTYINDSKGTNVGATLAAISGLGCGKNIMLIAGGEDKAGDYRPLKAAINKHVKQLVLIGECASKIAAQTAAKNACFAQDMQEAIQLATQSAKSGDIVLLSPACASFDMFKNYEHRGDVFIESVTSLEEVA